jgi:hypothetical protein
MRISCRLFVFEVIKIRCPATNFLFNKTLFRCRCCGKFAIFDREQVGQQPVR